jgi:hypothetical protein
MATAKAKTTMKKPAAAKQAPSKTVKAPMAKKAAGKTATVKKTARKG